MSHTSGQQNSLSTPRFPWSIVGGLAIVLVGFAAAPAIAVVLDPTSTNMDRVIAGHTELPRISFAIASGAALGLAGLLLQRLLANPLAEPGTVGISAGAQLALAIGLSIAPGLEALARSGLAFTGGIVVGLLMLGLAARASDRPADLLVAGSMIMLFAAALSSALILASGDYLFTVLLWGGGSLEQSGWRPTVWVTCTCLLVLTLSFASARALAVFGLGKVSATSAGLQTDVARIALLLLAVLLAATVTAEAGIIPFLGLAAPAMARALDARTVKQQLLAAPTLGAVLLLATDSIVSLVDSSTRLTLPTGAVTAILGTPVFVWLLLRLKSNLGAQLPLTGDDLAPERAARPARSTVWLAVLAFIVTLMNFGLVLGPSGLAQPLSEVWADAISIRLPQVFAAFTAGGLLALAGLTLQRLFSNPISSPEVLGVSGGAGVGLSALLLIAPFAGGFAEFCATVAGALVFLGLLMAFASRTSMDSSQLLLLGVAATALSSAIITLIVSSGTPQGFRLLAWLTGSLAGASMPWGVSGLALLVLSALALVALERALTLASLGETTATALGASVPNLRRAALALAGVTTGYAVLSVGPLTFVGFIAPVLVRALGVTRGLCRVVSVALTGGSLLVAAHWISTVAIYPYNLPLGLAAALFAIPLTFFVFIGSRRV